VCRWCSSAACCSTCDVGRVQDELGFLGTWVVRCAETDHNRAAADDAQFCYDKLQRAAPAVLTGASAPPVLVHLCGPVSMEKCCEFVSIGTADAAGGDTMRNLPRRTILHVESATSLETAQRACKEAAERSLVLVGKESFSAATAGAFIFKADGTSSDAETARMVNTYLDRFGPLVKSWPKEDVDYWVVYIAGKSDKLRLLGQSTWGHGQLDPSQMVAISADRVAAQGAEDEEDEEDEEVEEEEEEEEDEVPAF